MPLPPVWQRDRSRVQRITAMFLAFRAAVSILGRGLLEASSETPPGWNSVSSLWRPTCTVAAAIDSGTRLRLAAVLRGGAPRSMTEGHPKCRIWFPHVVEAPSNYRALVSYIVDGLVACYSHALRGASTYG